MRTSIKPLIIVFLLLITIPPAAGPAYAAPLYFPHVVTSAPWQTEIAIINTSPDQGVTGTLRAFSDEGQLVETRVVTLTDRDRRQIDVAAEFANHTDIGYIVYDTDAETVQGYMKLYREGRYRAAIPTVQEVNTSSEIYIPHIASDARWWTGISLVNTTAEMKELTITFNDGQTRSFTLNAREHKVFDVAQEFFNSQPQPDIRSAVIANAEGTVGLELFGDGNLLDGIPLTGNAVTTLYYPHVAAAGDGWWTGIVAYCPLWPYYGITVTSYSADGALLGSRYFTVTGHQYIGTFADLGLSDQTAWFRMDSMQGIIGFELFGAEDGSRLAAYAGRGGDGALAGVFPEIEKSGWTDIVFVNTEDTAASVTLTAYNDAGGAVATGTLTVEGHAKTVHRAEAIFPQDIDGATYIAYASDREVMGFQLNGSSDDTVLDGLPALAAGGAPPATVWQQSAGPEGEDVRPLAIDPSDSRIIYAGTNGGGIFKTTDGGATWTAINTGLTNTRISSLAIDPSDSSTIYAGTDGGIFKTTDGGATWRAINTGLANTRVSSLAIASNGQVVYAGITGSGAVGTGGGVYKTTDGGATWRAINSGLKSTRVSTLAVDPLSSRTLYAGTWDAIVTGTDGGITGIGGGVYKTTDGGFTWTEIALDAGLGSTMISYLAIDPKNSRTVYAVSGSTIYRTTDGGATWAAIRADAITTGISALAVDPASSQVLYVGTTGAYGCAGGNGGVGCGPDIPGSVFKTTDGGATWRAVKTGITNDMIYSLAVDPADSRTLYAGTNNNGVFRTIDGGAAWTAINTGTTGDIEALAIDPTDSRTVYAGAWGGGGAGRGGVYKTTDGGVVWTAMNTGLTNNNIQALAIDPKDSRTVYAGTYNGGVFKTNDGGASWTVINNGIENNAIYSLAIDPENSRTVYAGTDYTESDGSGGGQYFKAAEDAAGNGGVFKTTDGGASWTAIGLPNSRVYALAIDPANSRIVYAGTAKGICKSINGGVSWAAKSVGIGQPAVRSLVIDPSDSRIVYAGTDRGVFKTLDGGASWRVISNGIMNTNILSLAIDPSNSRTVYAGTLSGGIFKTANGGASWTSIKTGLTSTLIYTLAVDPTDGRTVYAGTGGGVFKTIQETVSVD